MGDHEEDMCETMQFELIVFLKNFPTVKRQIEEYIKELRCAADTVDKIHKGCAAAGTVAFSAGVVSGVLAAGGLLFAPVTGGASLTLCMWGAGVGAAAVATSVSAEVVKNKGDSRGRAQLKAVEEKSKGIMEPFSKMASEILPVLERLNKAFQNIGPIDPKFKLLGDDPELTEQILVLSNATTLLRATVFKGITLLGSIIKIMQDSKDLSPKAEVPTAAKLKEKAEDLEKKLQDLSGIYETLQKKRDLAVKAVDYGSPCTRDGAEI